MFAVIMAGGSGTRLWPLSRQKMPKQFHKFTSDKSLLQETYGRLKLKFKPEEIFISTIGDYTDEIKKHLPDLPSQNIIIEPALMGNAAACGLVSAHLERLKPGTNVIFVPADHSIKNTELFIDTISFAEKVIEKYPSHIITIGINPTKPDVNLGYIQMNEQIHKDGDFAAFSVKRFIEKPSLAKAEEYLDSWEYLWNSGMFVWKTNGFLSKMKKFMPATYESLQKIASLGNSPEAEKTALLEYGKVEKTSVDYGIMEKTDEIMVIPGDFGWSDIGTWNALYELISEQPEAKVISKGNHVSVSDENCLVLSGDKLIATVGLKDIVIVDSPDALLICDRSKSSEVKNLLEKLKEENKHTYL